MLRNIVLLLVAIIYSKAFYLNIFRENNQILLKYHTDFEIPSKNYKIEFLKRSISTSPIDFRVDNDISKLLFLSDSKGALLVKDFDQSIVFCLRLVINDTNVHYYTASYRITNDGVVNVS